METVDVAAIHAMNAAPDDQISPNSTWELDMPWDTWSGSPAKKTTDSPGKLRLDSYHKKTEEEIRADSYRRQEHAETARKERAQEEAERLAKEHAKAEQAKQRIAD